MLGPGGGGGEKRRARRRRGEESEGKPRPEPRRWGRAWVYEVKLSEYTVPGQPSLTPATSDYYSMKDKTTKLLQDNMGEHLYMLQVTRYF